MSNKYMNFEAALAAIKNGDKLYRAGWYLESSYVFLIRGSAVYQAINDRYSNPADASSAKLVTDAIYLKDYNGKLTPWTATQEDLLSDDWFILGKENDSDEPSGDTATPSVYLDDPYAYL